MQRLLTWALGLATAVLGVPTLIRLVGDSGRSLLVGLDVVVPLAVVPLVVLALAQVLLRRRRIALVTAGLLVLDAFWVVPLYVGDRVQRGEALTVMTANLRFGEADPSAVVNLVRHNQVDVLATEELTPAAVERLHAAGLDDLLPYHELAPFRAADGSGLWSRYPLDRLPPYRLRFQSPGAVIKTGTRQVVVRVVHPFPPTDGALYRADNAALRAQARDLDPTMPTLLAGDFNATNDNTVFRRLLGTQFRDASEVAGSGLHGTWSPNGWPFLLHLDHVLVDRHFSVRSTNVHDLPGSDHDAVIARLVVE
ncbi:MAG: Endonuclease/exonuclease/phosphatase [Frankiales bacterium]|nr:Endonuclease/exonuclease/phosphatase [Frankiales bacterium]